ncbi:MAG: YajQ family cyclic di-GMP-binding protein [Elusimicrobia bacterium]|nr:YajQ family cyclic di-GMP-binding protein [Elusimicrobiota bacterium]
MATDFSFDVVSKVDFNMVDEAITNALKEITNRYDFKDIKSEISFDKKANTLTLSSSDEFKVKAVYDVLLTKLSKRGVPLKNFQPAKIESALGGTAKQAVKIQQGIPQDKAREMVKLVKDNKLKVTVSIQADTLRVVSRSKDELQTVMALLRGHDFGITLQFMNYR